MSNSTTSIPPPPLHEDHDTPMTENDPLLQSGLRRGKKSRSGDIPAAIVAILSVLGIAGFTWYFVLSHNPKRLGWFAYHPLLQSASIVFFVYGILSLQRTTLEDPEAKRKGQILHQFWIALLAFPLIVAGTSIMLYLKGSHPHFTTWHGKFGFTTFVLIIIQALVGAGSLWFGGAAFGGGDKAKAIYKYHRMSGYTILTLLLITIHLSGAWSDWTVRNTAKWQRVVYYTVLPAAAWLAVGSRIRWYKMKFW